MVPLSESTVLSPTAANLPLAAVASGQKPILPGFAWLQNRPETIILLLVTLIGAGTGCSVVLFHNTIEWIEHLTLEDLMGVIAPWGAWTLSLVPILGGGVVGLLRWWLRDFSPSASTLADSSVPLAVWQPPAKLTAAAVSLGTGASLGPEGPSVEIGASLGILLAQVLRVSRERRRLLLGAGAAAGLAAGFNAPIAGVFLALELFLSTTFATTTVGVVLVAAVVASLVTQWGLGSQPAFELPVYEVRSPWELPLYLGLGGLASGVSLLFVRTIKLAQKLFAGELPGFPWTLPRPLQPMVGGALVGGVTLLLPQILGIGYETIEAILRNVSLSVPLLLVLLAAKLLLTALSLGSGLVGGIFAPAMFLGAVLGAAYAKLLVLLLPSLEIAAPPAYAMVGMAAVLAGSVRLPLTAILLLFEMTRDYRIILPLMAAVGISVLLVEWSKSKPADGLNLQQMGLSLEEDRTQELLSGIPVTAVMNSRPLLLTETTSLSMAATELIEQQLHSALVVDANSQLIGIVTLQDLNRTLLRSQTDPEYAAKTLTIGQICSRDLVWVHAQESLAVARQKLQARGLHQLPVLEPQAPHQVLGVLSAEAITLAWEMALSRKLLLTQELVADSQGD